MIDSKVFEGFCRELDVVEQTVYCVVDLKALGASQIRIEALRSLLTGEYRAHVYIKGYERLSLDGQTPPENYGFWVAWKDFPWTWGRTADDATRSALSFLRERCNSAE
jgi:hypothetical protein